jgi:hypothetical protein
MEIAKLAQTCDLIQPAICGYAGARSLPQINARAFVQAA